MQRGLAISSFPKNNYVRRNSCQATAFTFRDELQRAAEYSEAGQPPLRPIVEEFVAEPVATLATRHLETQREGLTASCLSQQTTSLKKKKKKKPTGFWVFLLLPKCFRIVTFKAPGRSLRLDTLSSWTVSVKAGHGDECSYFAWLENSSWPHLAQT